MRKQRAGSRWRGDLFALTSAIFALPSKLLSAFCFLLSLTSSLLALPSKLLSAFCFLLSLTLLTLLALPSSLLASSLLALPTGYTQLDKLEFNGGQWIATDCCPAAGDRFECDVTVDAVQSNATAAVFGTVREGEPERTFAFYVRQGGDDSTVVAYGDTACGGFFPRGKKVTLSVGPDGAMWTWEGGFGRLELTPGSARNGMTPLLIGDANAARLDGDSVPAGTGAVMALHRFRIWRGGLELLHDYVPCRNSSDEIGLYDALEKDENARFKRLEPQPEPQTVKVTVANGIPHVLNVIVSNRTEKIGGKKVGDDLVYEVKKGDDIFVGYEVEKDYVSLVENPISYPGISKDERVDETVIRTVRRIAENIPYRTWDAKTAAMVDCVCSNAFPVTAGTQVLADGQWYAVTGTVSRGTITVSGSAHLILCDGTKLTANAITNGALTVYGQPSGCGVLEVSGTVATALTVQGGRISAKALAVGSLAVVGGTLAADAVRNDSVMIAGGSVKAKTIENAPSNGVERVYCVTAKWSEEGRAGSEEGRAGSEEGRGKRLNVGGLGKYGTNDIYAVDNRVYLWLPDGTHRFTVSDGTTTNRYRAIVKGEGITVEPLPTYGFHVNGTDVGDGSDTGWNYTNGVLSLTNAMTYVLSGVATNNEMRVRATDAAKVVLSNMVVFASERPAIGVAQTNLTVAAGQMLKTGDTPETLRYAKAYDGERCVRAAPCVTVTVKDIPHVTGFTVSNAVETITNAAGAATCRVMVCDDVYVGYTVEARHFSKSPNPLVYPAVTSDITVDAGTIEILPYLPYRAWNGTMRQMEDRVCTNYEVVAENTTTFESNTWYVVTDEVPRNKLIIVNGEAHLILCDGAKLTVQGDRFLPGVRVWGEDSLHIYGQSAGTGALVATGGYRGAGIGGSEYAAGGTVTIDGGTVTAMGGGYGAGIGGGDVGDGGTVTVNGGRVTAIGKDEAKGIGGGGRAGGGTVTINGGTVNADGWNGRGLGGTAVIDGGSVRTELCESQPKSGAGAPLYCVTAKLSEEGRAGSEEGRAGSEEGRAGSEEVRVGRLAIEGLGGYGTNDIYAVEGKVYLWLPDGTHRFTVSDGTTTNRYFAVVNGADITVEPLPPGVPVTPGRSSGPYTTAEDATNAMWAAFIRPRDDVAAVLGTDALLKDYRKMFGFAVTGGGEAWFVEAVLTLTARTNLAATATAATRQIPVAVIARLPDASAIAQQPEIATLAVATSVTVDGCAPGFFYSLYDGRALTNIVADANATNLNVLCGADAKVTFPEVKKPSDAAGFFRVGVRDAPGVTPSDVSRAPITILK